MRSDETGDHMLGSVEGLDGTGTDMSRLISISDGVFAFALTFLVINLVLPTPGRSAAGSLFDYLSEDGPAIGAYALSFFIIASWWGAHHRLFSPIVRYDGILVRLNTMFLLIIAITPFLVGILYSFGPPAGLGPATASARLAVIIYGGVQAIAGLILLAIWRHSTRNHRLVRATLPSLWIQSTERNQIANVAVFAVSIPVALVAPFISILMWVLVIVGLRYSLGLRRPKSSSWA
jgi:uncharacterized membrane protein